jgi:hypothetical protein
LFPLLSIVDPVELQVAEPHFRPALIGYGPKALVNVINMKRLVEKGQRDGFALVLCESYWESAELLHIPRDARIEVVEGRDGIWHHRLPFHSCNLQWRAHCCHF